MGKSEGDKIMILNLYQIFFKIVVLMSWLSIIFNIAGQIWNDEILFASLRNAITLYFISISMAIILTYLCFEILNSII